MVIPIPAPMSFHSFGGWKASLFSDHHIYGPEGVHLLHTAEDDHLSMAGWHSLWSRLCHADIEVSALPLADFQNDWDMPLIFLD